MSSPFRQTGFSYRQRPGEQNHQEDASNSKVNEGTNQAKREKNLSVSPNDDAINIAKNLFHKGTLTSYEAGFFHRFKKETDKSSFLDQNSVICNSQIKIFPFSLI